MLTLSSRVLGLCRDMISTAVLNAYLSDALYLAWTVPNIFRNLFGEGALSSAFIPVFTRVLEQEGRARAFLLARRVITCIGLFLFAVVLGLVGLSLILPTTWLSSFLGTEPGKLADVLVLMRILLPYLAIVCVLAQCQAVLNSLNYFFLPALSPAILNAVWIAAAIVAGFLAFENEQSRAVFIACGIMVGGGVQVLLFVAALKRQGFTLRPSVNLNDSGFRRVLATTVPMIVGVSAVQMNVLLVDRGVAYALIPGDGGVTHLFVGNRLMQFPFALIGIALTTAVFPLLSRLSAAGDTDGMKENFSGAMRINFFLSIPAAAGLMLLAHPIISLFFQRGEFTPDRVDATACALIGYTVGIPFLSAGMLLTRVFYAMGQWRLPVLVSCILVLVNIGLDLLLVGPFAEAGISAATSVSALLQAILLFYLLRKKIGPLGGGALLSGIVRTFLLTAFLAAAVLGALWVIGPEPLTSSIVSKAMRVLVPVLLGFIVFTIPARWLCRFEWNKIMEVLAGRRKA